MMTVTSGDSEWREATGCISGGAVEPTDIELDSLISSRVECAREAPYTTPPPPHKIGTGTGPRKSIEIQHEKKNEGEIIGKGPQSTCDERKKNRAMYAIKKNVTRKYAKRPRQK